MAEPLPVPATIPLRPEIWSQLTAGEQAWVVGLMDVAEQARQQAAAAAAVVQTSLERIEKLEGTVAALTARLGQNSTNSHKPPSSDKPAVKRTSTRKTGKKRRGGQPGHTGHQRVVPPEALTSRTDCYPDACAHCRYVLLPDHAVGEARPHQVFELPLTPMEVHQYDLHRCQCPGCGGYTEGRPPPAHATGQGPRLTAFIGVLTAAFFLSRRKVEELLEILTGLAPSLGTVDTCTTRAATAAAPVVAEIEATLPNQPSVHLDETSWKEGTKKRWMWVIATGAVACFGIHTRGHKQLQAWLGEELADFRGVVHSDRWQSYLRFARRQLCWSHLVRDLQGIVDAKGPGSQRAREMVTEAAGMFRFWHRYREGGLSRPELQKAVAPFRARLRSFCEAGSEQEKNAKWRRLGSALVELWAHVFRFLDEDGVEPTNNHAERMIRPAVQWRRISQGTRTPGGSRTVTLLLSVVQTCRLQGRSALDVLQQALIALWTHQAPPSLLPPAVATP